MSSAPIHGGGITLHRVLGSDLGLFSWMAKTIQYASEGALGPSGACRQHLYPWWQIEPTLRPFFGCTVANKIAFHPLTRTAFSKSVARRLLRDEASLERSKLLVCPQAEITLIVLEELRKHVQIGYVTWMMDDHLVRWIDGQWVYPAGVEDRMRVHLNAAERVHVISPAMQRFYKERFGVDSTVLCGPATPVNRHHHHPTGKHLRLAYFGSLGRWQNDALEVLSLALRTGEVSLDIFSHNPDMLPAPLRIRGTRLLPGVASSEVLALSGTYDAVVLPISFRSELRNMSFFNIATKFSECMASRVPTLIIGPADAIMVKIARMHGTGVIVDQTNSDSLESAISELHDPTIRKSVTTSAIELARMEFSCETMRSRWAPSRRFLFEGITSQSGS